MAVNINIDSQVSQTITDGVTDKAPSENAVFDALALKVDKVTGKQLSTEDYTTTEKSKLAGIAAGAEVNVNADWNATSGDAQILNKPTISSSITIGTTPITSGVAGRVLFEGSGNVVQEDAGLFWDNTNKRLGVGATPNTSTRLDVRSQGALSTDVAFRVRNSADNFDLVKHQGDGTSVHLINSATITPKTGINLGGTNSSAWFNIKTINSSGNNQVGFQAEAAGRVSLFTDYGNVSGGGSTAGHLWHDPIVGSSYFYIGENLQNGLGIRLGAISAGAFQPTGAWMQVAKFGGTWAQSVVSIGTFLGATTATSPATNLGGNTLRILNGTAPTASFGDTFCLYSADITAGNAAPHFRTENGSVIKLYKQDLPTSPTNAELATFLSNLGLANLI